MIWTECLQWYAVHCNNLSYKHLHNHMHTCFQRIDSFGWWNYSVQNSLKLNQETLFTLTVRPLIEIFIRIWYYPVLPRLDTTIWLSFNEFWILCIHMDWQLHWHDTCQRQHFKFPQIWTIFWNTTVAVHHFCLELGWTLLVTHLTQSH